MSTTATVNSETLCYTIPKPQGNHSGYVAILTGANGISGFHTLRVLLRSPERWSRIYALSRRPPPSSMMDLLSAEERSRVTHVACDFMSSAEDIAKSLKDSVPKADYIFFYSYLQPAPKAGAAVWSNAQELVDVNTALLRNFLGALPLANIHPKRFLLQTGAKHYGAHLGVIRTPAVESDPRVELEPNFYYPQEDMLMKYCRDQKTSWNVVRPAWIIGATSNAQMNALYPLAVYAAIQQHLGRPLNFPSNFAMWQSLPYHSTALLAGYLTEWAVLEDKCKDEAFNSTDTHALPWNRFWPELGRWFGVDDIPPPKEDESDMFEFIPPHGKNAPIGYGPPMKYKIAFSLTEWAKQEENAKAWQEIMQKHDLTHNPFENVELSFPFADHSMLSVSHPLGMTKARRLGWTGFVDTIESIWVMYDEMHRIGMLPPMKVNDPRPCM